MRGCGGSFLGWMLILVGMRRWGWFVGFGRRLGGKEIWIGGCGRRICYGGVVVMDGWSRLLLDGGWVLDPSWQD